MLRSATALLWALLLLNLYGALVANPSSHNSPNQFKGYKDTVMEGQQKRTDLQMTGLQGNQSGVEAAQENKSRAYRQIVEKLTVKVSDFEPVIQRYIHFEEISSQYWSTAESTCQEKGGHLEPFDLEGELEALRPELKNSTRYWIGIRNVHLGEFKVWATGMPARYLKWADGYPHNRDTYNCVYLYNGFMYNFLCDSSNHFICQVLKDI